MAKSVTESFDEDFYLVSQVVENMGVLGRQELEWQVDADDVVLKARNSQAVSIGGAVQVVVAGC